VSHAPVEHVLNILNLFASYLVGVTFTAMATLLDILKNTLSSILQEMLFFYMHPYKSLYFIKISAYCVDTIYERHNIITHLKSNMKEISDTIEKICQVEIFGDSLYYIY
jgi:DNA-binding IclR family transcriptional regulator